MSIERCARRGGGSADARTGDERPRRRRGAQRVRVRSEQYIPRATARVRRHGARRFPAALSSRERGTPAILASCQRALCRRGCRRHRAAWLPPCRDPQPRAAVPPPGASSRRTDPSVPLSAQRCAAHGRDAHAARTQRAAAARVADLLPQRLHPRPLPGGHGGAGRARRGAAERHVCDADGRPRAAADDPVRRPAGAGEGRRGTVRRAATDRRGTAGLARRHHWQGAAAPQRAVSRHAGRSADGLARAAARDRDAAACRGHAGIRRGSHHGGAVALAGAVRAHRARGVVRRLGRHRQRVGRSPRDCRRGRAAARQRNAGGDRRRDPVAGARPGATRRFWGRQGRHASRSASISANCHADWTRGAGFCSTGERRCGSQDSAQPIIRNSGIADQL